jgi:hypothetical protein
VAELVASEAYAALLLASPAAAATTTAAADRAQRAVQSMLPHSHPVPLHDALVVSQVGIPPVCA